MKHGKTAVYTILKNEAKYIEKWLYYADPFDYKVLLDTGSTDGSWEMLQEAAAKDPKLIIEQKTFTPWRFNVARVHNLSMVPTDTKWCLSPDLDEYFSINTHDEMERIIDAVPHITNIACDRLDIYSRTVRVGPPNYIPTNKIHRYGDYTWVQPIYEHLKWKHSNYEKELYSPDIFLVHDQDFNKQERPELYFKMLDEEYNTNPSNTWCLWYLINHYYKTKNLEMFIKTSCDYVRYCDNKQDKKYKEIYSELENILRYSKEIDFNTKEQIRSSLIS
jgi:glycosyltransferase involved in cell wall biosynthesis